MSWLEIAKATNGTVHTIFEQLRHAGYGAHYLVVYPDITTLRELYSYYIKIQLEENNEVVVLIPYYESGDVVRRILTENSANIDVQKYEKQGSLLIIDSVKAYFGLKTDLEQFVHNLVKKAESMRKNGVSVITDAGSFYLFEIIEQLIALELSLPSKYDIRLKRFCIYNQQDFDMLTEKQKQKLLRHHGKNLVITNP